MRFVFSMIVDAFWEGVDGWESKCQTEVRFD